LRRLVWPLLPLLVAWVAIVAIEYARGVRPELIRYGSQVAFIPIWFLAVYIMIVLLVPAMEAAWTRFGLRSFLALTAAAIVGDILYFVAALRWLGFVHFLSVWGQLSPLASPCLADRFPSRGLLFVCAARPLPVLLSLVLSAPYPVSMVGAPPEPVSNTTPP